MNVGDNQIPLNTTRNTDAEVSAVTALVVGRCGDEAPSLLTMLGITGQEVAA